MVVLIRVREAGVAVHEAELMTGGSVLKFTPRGRPGQGTYSQDTIFIF